MGAELASFELGFALFQEGLDAFLHVLGLHQRQQLQEDVVHVRLERLLHAEPHHPLRRLHGERRVLRHLRRERARFVHEPVGRHHLADEPVLERLLR